MRIVILGARGFIGSHLAEALSTEELVLVDYPNDIRNYKRVFERSLGADAIINLAAVSGISAFEEDPTEAYEINTLAAMRIAHMARALHAHYLFASSGAVYGGGYSAEDTPHKPQNGYGHSKSIADNYICRVFDNSTAMRFSNVYGSRHIDEKSSAVVNFIRAARNNEPVVLHGAGDSIRDFVHVDDVCQSIIGLLEHGPVGPVNISTGVGVTVKSAAEHIFRLIRGDKPTFEYQCINPGVKMSILCNNKLKNAIGFVPSPGFRV